jgi:putative membrane protein
MIIKGYKIDWIFAMLAIIFMMAAIVSNNFAFMGSVIICLIFGVKKINNPDH